MSAPTSTGSSDTSTSRGPGWSGWAVAGWPIAIALLLLGLGVVYARLRWPGAVPVGSDNDEYRLVGQALAAFEPPVVAGVEGTKYPLGYPAVLAVLEWLRLPVPAAAQALNLLALAGVVGGVGWIAGRSREDLPASPGGALAAGGLVIASAAVWNDVYSIMPELPLLAVITGMLVAVDRPVRAQRVGVLVALAVAAVLLKTMASLVVGGMVLGLLAASWRDAPPSDGQQVAAHPGRWRLLLPGAVGAATVFVGMLVMRPFPTHTTGYVAMFTLADPDDASLGRLGVGGLLRRTLEDVPWTLMDLGRAITVVGATRRPAITIAIVGLSLGVLGAWRLGRRTPLGWVALGMVLVYAVGMTTWPYHSARFGLPLVPVAALGAGWLARATGRALGKLAGGGRPVLDVLAGAAVLAALAAISLPTVATAGSAAAERLEHEHAALATVERWAQQTGLGDHEAVSFDYREVSRVIGRAVEPIGYTSDPDALWSQVEGADHLVVLDFYPKRTRQVEVLLDTYPDRFEPTLDGPGVRVFAVRY